MLFVDSLWCRILGLLPVQMTGQLNSCIHWAVTDVYTAKFASGHWAVIWCTHYRAIHHMFTAWLCCLEARLYLEGKIALSASGKVITIRLR